MISRCTAPQVGYELRAQSETQRASMATVPGSWNRLQKRGARALDTDAKASTVT